MPELFPISRNEKVIITARTLPSLLEGGVPPFDGEQTQKAAFYVEKGILSAIRLLPEGHEDMKMAPEWRRIILPPRQFLVPAFVDCHLHLALDGVGGFRSFSAPPSPQQLFTRLQALATAGVLAVRDGGDQYGSAFTARKLIAYNNPEMGPLPQIVATGPALFRRGHYGAKLGGDGLNEPKELEYELQRRKYGGAEQLKVILSGLVSLQEFGKVGPLQFNLTELQSIVRFANTLDLPVMVHASSDAAVRLAVQAGVHSVEHGYFVEEETLKLMAEKGVAWVPTLAPLATLNIPVADRIVEGHLNMLERARTLRVTVCLGTDSGAPGVSWSGGYWLELALLARAGFTPPELLTLAAVSGAFLLGLERELGHITVGKPPYWLCLDMDFLAGRIERRTLKGLVFLK